jgi:ABC-2 type transport system permease protein
MGGYLRLELGRAFRSPAFLFYSVFLPVVLYLVLTHRGALEGPFATAPHAVALVAVAAYSALGAVLSYGTGVADERAAGWLRQLRLTPLPGGTVFAGKAITAVVLALPPVLVLCGVAATVQHVALSPARWAAMVGVLWLGTAPFALLGLGLGYRYGAPRVQWANLLALLCLGVLGGIAWPMQQLPHWLQSAGRLSPAHGYADLAWRAVSAGANPVVYDLAVLGAWAALFALFAWSAQRKAAPYLPTPPRVR